MLNVMTVIVGQIFKKIMLGIFAYQLEPRVLSQIIQVFLSVLESQDVDIVVIVTVVQSLGLILNVDGFISSGLLSMSDIIRIVGILCNLTTKRLDEEETKEIVICVIKDLLNTLNNNMLQDLEIFSALTSHLSNLWEGSNANSPLRLTIIEVI